MKIEFIDIETKTELVKAFKLLNEYASEKHDNNDDTVIIYIDGISGEIRLSDSSNTYRLYRDKIDLECYCEECGNIGARTDFIKYGNNCCKQVATKIGVKQNGKNL